MTLQGTAKRDNLTQHLERQEGGQFICLSANVSFPVIFFSPSCSIFSNNISWCSSFGFLHKINYRQQRETKKNRYKWTRSLNWILPAPVETHFIRQWFLACYLALTSPLVSGRKCVQVCLSSLLRNDGHTVFGSAVLGSSFPFCCSVSHHHARRLPHNHPHFSLSRSYTQSYSFMSFLSVSVRTVRRRVHLELSFREKVKQQRRRRRSEGGGGGGWETGSGSSLFKPRQPQLLRSCLESWKSSDALVAAATVSASHSVSRPWSRHLLSPWRQPLTEGGMLPLPPIRNPVDTRTLSLSLSLSLFSLSVPPARWRGKRLEFMDRLWLLVKTALTLTLRGGGGDCKV